MALKSITVCHHDSKLTSSAQNSSLTFDHDAVIFRGVPELLNCAKYHHLLWTCLGFKNHSDNMTCSVTTFDVNKTPLVKCAWYLQGYSSWETPAQSECVDSRRPLLIDWTRSPPPADRSAKDFKDSEGNGSLLHPVPAVKDDTTFIRYLDGLSAISPK